jgi:hypothetical protein
VQTSLSYRTDLTGFGRSTLQIYFEWSFTMTALTHAQCIDAFEHITRNVMWQEDEDPLLKALAHAGIDDINGLLILDAQQIDELMNDTAGTWTQEPDNDLSGLCFPPNP